MDPLPQVEYVQFVPADLTFAPHAFARCYLALYDQDAVIEFSNRFNGYIFVDSKGNSSCAIVELAMFHRVPRKYRQDVGNDTRCGIIEEEVEYKKFVYELEEAENFVIPTLEQQLKDCQLKESSMKSEHVQETPLIRHIIKLADEKTRKIEERKRERRLRLAEKRVTTSDGNAPSASGIGPGPRQRKSAPEPRTEKREPLRRTDRETEQTIINTKPTPKEPRPSNERTFVRSSAPRDRINAMAKDNTDKKRTKARPEREIYRPGQRNRPAEGSTSSSTK